MKRLIARKFLVLTLALLSVVAASAFAQEMLQLGNMSYSRAAARPLLMPVARSAGFFRGVGGVAFNAVAEGLNNTHVAGLRYDATSPDGSRLVIHLKNAAGDKIVRGALYDWELVPIARFAKDENGSAMTLFGQLSDEAAQEELLQKGHRVINYHPALDNTLLGLRLFQADVLIIQPNAADLFRKGNQLILGAGETGHDLQANLRRFAAVGQWQDRQRADGLVYQSYVVGDLDQKVTFSAAAERISFTGSPIWYAWRTKGGDVDDNSELRTLAARYEAAISAHNRKVEDAKRRAASMTEPEQERVVTELRQSASAIEAMESEITGKMNAHTDVEPMLEYSKQLTEKIRENEGINPIVYAAVTDVMHYRALFKHFQRRDAAAYSRFVDSLKSVAVAPAVATPTIQYSGPGGDAAPR